MLRCKGLTVLVILSLTLPFAAFPGTGTVGTVQSSLAASVRGVSLTPGTSVFPGDTVSVGANGGALISFPGGAQLILAQKSSIEIAAAEDGGAVQFAIAQGAVRFRCTEKRPVAAMLGDATFGAAPGTAGVGYIVRSSAREARIGTERGTMVLTTSHDGRSVTLPEGTAMDVKLVPDTSDDVERSRGKHRPKGGFIVLTGILIVGGTALGAAIAAWHEPKSTASVSPFSPQ